MSGGGAGAEDEYFGYMGSCALEVNDFNSGGDVSVSDEESGQLHGDFLLCSSGGKEALAGVEDSYGGVGFIEVVFSGGVVGEAGRGGSEVVVGD